MYTMRSHKLYPSLLGIMIVILLFATSSTSSFSNNKLLLPPDDPLRMKWMYEAIHKAVLELDRNSCGSQEKHACGGRDFSNGAVATYLLSNGTNASGAIHWLSKVQPGGSFVGQGFCALAHEANFMDNLNSKQRAYVLDSINKALPGLSKWQGADESYSNMCSFSVIINPNFK